jgi:hypothetical protein
VFNSRNKGNEKGWNLLGDFSLFFSPPYSFSGHQYKKIVGIGKDDPAALSMVQTHIAGIPWAFAFFGKKNMEMLTVPFREMPEVHFPRTAVVIYHNDFHILA